MGLIMDFISDVWKNSLDTLTIKTVKFPLFHDQNKLSYDSLNFINFWRILKLKAKKHSFGH